MGRRRRGTLIMLQYVHSYRDQHGLLKHYLLRPRRPKVRLPGQPGSAEFMAAYNAAIAEPAPPRPPIGAKLHAPDSVAHWISLYLASAAFAILAPDTRRTRKNLLERFRVRHGDKRATKLEQANIEKMIGLLTPVVARNFLKALRPWLKWCVTQGLRTDNPAIDVERPSYKSDGYRPWTDDHVVLYRNQHAVGTRARLAFEILVNTGAARADATRLGRQHVRDGIISFRRHKTGVLVEIPMLAELQATIDATPLDPARLTFLVTEYGRPFSDAGFTNWFRDRCREAGIPVGYSAHGVRKYAATLRANLGATAYELMAWFGWLTIREAERYTRDAARRTLAINMAVRLGS
jgi:hypothetical protein